MCSHNERGSSLPITSLILFLSGSALFSSVIPEYFRLRDKFLSVGLSAPVPVLAERGNDDIERFSCHYVG